MANYTIKPGDTLAKLAQQNNTSVEELMRVNPNITDKNMIFAGSNLNLPDTDINSQQSILDSQQGIGQQLGTSTTGSFNTQLKTFSTVNQGEESLGTSYKQYYDDLYSGKFYEDLSGHLNKEQPRINGMEEPLIDALTRKDKETKAAEADFAFMNRPVIMTPTGISTGQAIMGNSINTSGKNSYEINQGKKQTTIDEFNAKLRGGKLPGQEQVIDGQSIDEKEEVKEIKNRTNQFNIPVVEKSLEQTLTAFGAAAKKDEDGNRDILGMGLAGGASLIKGVRAGLTGYGIANSQQQAAQEARDKVDTELRDNYEMREGGEVTESELETGAYLTGLQVFLKPNAEVEGGEYVNQPGEDGIQEVVGAKHEDGGVEVTLEKGAKVISNAGTPSKEDIKEFKKEYNLKVGKKETYADVIDKYTKKIGLDKVIEEHAGLLEKIEDQQDVDDTATARLNLQILVEKNTKLEERRRDLEKTREEFSDMIFEKQEMAKPEGERSSQFKYGGTYDKEMVDEIREQYGLTPDQAEEILQSNELPKYDGGGTSPYHPAILAEAERLGITPQELVQKISAENPGGDINNNFNFEAQEQQAYTIPQGDEVYTHPDVKQAKEYKTATAEFDKETAELFQSEEEVIIEAAAKEMQTTTEELKTQIAKLTADEAKSFLTEAKKKLVDQDDLSDTQADIDARLNPPFQYTAPPSSLQLSTKVTPEYHTIEGNKVSPEAGLVEINRAAQSAMDVARSSGTAQGEAMMADILAQQMQATTGVVGQADAINAQEQARVDAYNAQVADKQSLSEAQSALDYEAKTFKAQDTTNKDIQSYFDFYNKQNIDNYNAQKNLELLNQFQDKYWFNPETNKVEIKEGSANVTPNQTTDKKN